MLLNFTSWGRVAIRLDRWRQLVSRYLVPTKGPEGPYDPIVFRLCGAARFSPVRRWSYSPVRHFSLHAFHALSLFMITHVFFNFPEWQIVAVLFSRKRFAKRSGTRFPTHENVFAALSFLCAGEKNNAQMLISITCESYLLVSPWPFLPARALWPRYRSVRSGGPSCGRGGCPLLR